MKAFVTYERLGSEKVQEAVKVFKKFEEDHDYLFSINWYAQKDVSAEADKFVKEAIQKLDGSMKGWTPVNEGTETHYKIYHTENGIEYSYTRHYTK